MITVVGILGLVMILAAFASNEFGLLERKSYPYNGLNLVGSVMLGAYAYALSNAVFVALEVIWAAISIYFIIKLARN